MAAAATSQIRIDVQSTGVERATAALDKLVRSEESLVRITDQTTKLRERNEAAIERLARKYDAEYRAAQDVERATKQLDRARAAGLGHTEAYVRATAALNRATNDNAKLSALQAHQWLNLGRQGQDALTMLAMGASPLQVITSQGAQIYDVFASSRGGATAALKEFGAVATRALFSPIGAAGALAGAIAGVSFEAGKAQKQLAELATQSRATGLSAETLQGAKVVGAGAGLDEKASLAAFGAAGRQFEAYSRNSGNVLSTLQQVDKSFISVVDKARSAGEFVDILNTKIAALPTRQAEQLASALYGDEAAKRLLHSIQAGEVSMRALREASGATGLSLGQSASAAEQMQNKIAAAAAEADTKLLNAFRNVRSPTEDIKLGWYGVVGAIADAVEKSERLQRTMSAMTSWSALFKEIGRGYDAVDKMLGARPVSRLEDDRPRLARPGDIPFPNFAEARASFLPNLVNPGVGASRHLFEKEKARGGQSDAAREAEQYTKITRELENQLRLAQTIGTAHDAVSLAIKIENEQLKLGASASAEHKQHVADLVTRIDEATKAQERLTEQAKATGEAYASISNTFAGGIKDVLKGGKPGDALTKSLTSIQDSLYDSILTGSGPFAKMLGLGGKDGATGGLFGSIGDLLGINGGKGKMDVQTLNVQKVSIAGGGLDSALGVGGGLLGSLGSLGGGSGSGGGLLGGIVGLGSKLLGGFGLFAEGGIVGASRNPMGLAPISAFIGAPQFAAGGAVGGGGGGVPIIAHPGELILNHAQQRNVAGAMGRQEPTVNVNISGAPAGTKVQESRDANGNRRVDVMLDEAVAKGIASPRGQEALRTSGQVARR
jgi:hypothetical protein